MGFTTGTEEETLQEKAIPGRHQKAAVSCWFTSTGRAIPQLVKYMDEDGSFRTLKNIQVLTTDQKYYGGILSRKYVCRTLSAGRTWDFTLLYYPESGIWNLILPEFPCLPSKKNVL
ncbi:MAG: hypothetical protein Q4F41_09045 [Eubacteriales bacterium]|nr:hypothetical protein [Eubacteriales bacterium]